MRPDGLFAFGTFEFDSRSGELRRRGLRLKIQAKPATVLALLVRNAGAVVSQDVLRKALWPDDTFVDFEQGLGSAIWKIRTLLGDTADNPRFVETVARRGYRFIAPIREAAAEAGPARKMLAVLPFQEQGKPADDYFADGLTEELIAHLGRLNPKSLAVIARTSAMRYKGSAEPLPAIASELGASFLLLGSVRRDTRRIRVTAELVSAADQVQIWTERYDRVLQDAISVQTELAEQIAKALAIELLPEEKARAAKPQTQKLEAYELYLQGRHHWNKRATPAVVNAIDYFTRAVEADPNYALAYAGLADCHLVLGFYGESAPAEAFGRAKQYASRALEIDPDLAEAHSSLAFCLLQFDWDARAAEREHLQAVQLNPNCAPAHHWYGLTLTQLGRFPDALRSLRRALELDPFSFAIHSHIGRLSYFSRDYDRAQQELRRAGELDRNYLPGRYFLALTMAAAGQKSESVREFETLVEEWNQHPILVSGLAYACSKAGKKAAAKRAIDLLTSMTSKRRVPPYCLGFALAGLGDAEGACRALEEAYAERNGWLFYLKMEPAFDGIRSHPHFADLVARMEQGGARSSAARSET